MPVDVGKIRAEIELRIDKYRQQLKEFKNATLNATKSINDDAEKTSGKVSAAWKAGFALVSLYGVKAANAIKNAFLGTIDTFAGFEQSLANTQSVARATEEEFKDLSAAAKEVGATTRSTAAEAADALYFLASAGFSAAESIAALEGVNALAIATNSDLAKTSELVAVTIRQYGLETSQATDVANIFTAAITDSLATLDKLGNAFEYVGPIAAGLGYSVEQTTAALELLFNKGFSGEKAGRALRRILVDLADSTSIVNRRLGRLGITFDEVNPAANSLGDIFDTLREKGVDATNAASIFGKISGAQLQALISTASDAAGGIIELEQNITGTNRAFEAMDIQMDTLQGSLDQFKNATEAVEIATGEGLEPVLRSVVDTATLLVRQLAKLSPNILALGASIATVTGIALTLGIAIKGAVTALASMGVLAAGTTVALGPLVGGMIAVVAAITGIIAASNKLNEINLDRLDKEFGGLAQETNVAEEELKSFYSSAEKLTKAAKLVPPSVLSDAEKLRRLFQNWAEAYSITEEQAIKLFKRNTDLVNLAGEALTIVEDQLAAEQALAAEQQKIAEQYQAYADSRKKSEEEAELRRRQAENDERIRLQNTAEAYASLQLAFERAAEFQILLGKEYDRNGELSKAYLSSLQNLIEQGYQAESKEVQDLIKQYARLQEQFGEVSADGLTDTEKRIKAQKEIAERLAQIVQEEKLALSIGQEYNAQKERQDAILRGINALIEEGFTIEGIGIQRILQQYGPYLDNLETVNKLADTYQDKIDKLKETELETLEEQRALAIQRAEGNEIAIVKINEYFDLLKAVKAKEEDEKVVDIATDYLAKIQELNATEVERLAIQRKAALATIEGFKEAEDAVNEYYDALTDAARLQQFQDTFTTVAGIIGDAFDAINDAIQLAFDNQIAGIEARRDAELAAAGLLEETEKERLERELAEAIATGDAVAENDAKNALDKYNIEVKYQKQVADAEYKAALANWGFTLLGAIANTASAVVQALPNIPLSIAVGAIGAAQTGIVAAQKPQKPAFANGGIVPGTSFSGDQIDARVNSGEMILNRQQQTKLFDMIKIGRAAPTRVIVYVGRQPIIDTIAEASQSGELIIDGRAVI